MSLFEIVLKPTWKDKMKVRIDIHIKVTYTDEHDETITKVITLENIQLEVDPTEDQIEAVTQAATIWCNDHGHSYDGWDYWIKQ